MVAVQSEQRAWRATLWLTAGMSLLHMVVIGRFDLSVDEAHYALYGLYPDWSYFDHPPLVGWLQAAVLQVSSQEWALRLWPILLGAFSTLYLHRLAERLLPGTHGWVGTVSGALLQSALIFQLLSMALVPETPLLLCALVAALHIHRALHEGGRGDWLIGGIALGLAGLSKYTAITLVLSLLLYIIVSGTWRRLLNPWPWIAILLAVLLVVPVFYWNGANDWLSFRYQLDHGVPERPWQLGRFALAQAGQLLAYSPGIYLFGLIAIVSALGQWRDEGPRYLLLLALPPLILFSWGAGFNETLPHWPLLGWVVVMPLIANWSIRNWQRRWVRIGLLASGGYSLVLTIVIHSLLWTPWLSIEGQRHPLGDLIGWRQAAQQAGSIYDKLPEAESEPKLFIGHWYLASRIAWYARPRPLQVIDQRHDQFDLWYGSPSAGSWGVLIVPEQYLDTPERSGLARFERCDVGDDLPILVGGVRVQLFRLHICEGYREQG